MQGGCFLWCRPVGVGSLVVSSGCLWVSLMTPNPSTPGGWCWHVRLAPRPRPLCEAPRRRGRKWKSRSYLLTDFSEQELQAKPTTDSRARCAARYWKNIIRGAILIAAYGPNIRHCPSLGQWSPPRRIRLPPPGGDHSHNEHALHTLGGNRKRQSRPAAAAGGVSLAASGSRRGYSVRRSN